MHVAGQHDRAGCRSGRSGQRVEAWVYEPSYGANVRILDFGNPGLADNVLVHLDSTSGKPAFQVIGEGSVIAPERIPTNLFANPFLRRQRALSSRHEAGLFDSACHCVLLCRQPEERSHLSL